MTQTSIIICGTCEGRGYTERDELVDYHRREYNTIRTKCRHCGGSGRLRKVVRTEVTAFVPEELE